MKWSIVIASLGLVAGCDNPNTTEQANFRHCLYYASAKSSYTLTPDVIEACKKASQQNPPEQR